MATFGYSVGDFFTAIAVLSKIIQTLNDTQQSHSEHQNLLSDLEDLKLVFEELKRYSTTKTSVPLRQNIVTRTLSKDWPRSTTLTCSAFWSKFRSLTGPLVQRLRPVSPRVSHGSCNGPFSLSMKYRRGVVRSL